MSNQRANYSFIAFTLSLILLGSGFLGSIPYVMADEDDDKKEKLQKLKAIVAKLLEIEKCPDKFKYGEICDRKKPEIEIKFPEKNDEVLAGSTTITGKAKDDQTGIKKVEVRINNGPFHDATLLPGDNWELTEDLEPGKNRVTAKATDLVGNISRDRVLFEVI